MKKFRFKLETVLELRRRREEEIKLELGKKNSEILAARKDLTASAEALKELQYSEKLKRTEVKDAGELRWAVAYRYKLKQDILRKARTLDDLGAQAAEIRKKIVRATQERRAIEIVRDHQYEAWRREYHAREQAFIDDVSQQGFIRRSRDEKLSVMS
jgi:flagellar protein FliJ